MSPWKVILATMVIFGSGVITGGLLMKSAIPAIVAREPAQTVISSNQPPPLGRFQQPSFLRQIQKQLDLTPGQHDEIEKIMKESQERTRKYWDQISPQLRVEMKQVRQEIRDVLNPGQQRRFDELLRTHPRKEGLGLGLGTNRPNRQVPQNQPAGQTNNL